MLVSELQLDVPTAVQFRRSRIVADTFLFSSIRGKTCQRTKHVMPENMLVS